MDAKQLRDGDFFETTGNLFKAIKESFEAVKLNVWTFLGLVFIPLLLFIAAVPFVLLPLLTGTDDGVAASVLLAVVAVVVIVIIGLTFLPAIIQTQIASVRGQQVGFEQAFRGGLPYVLRFIGLGLLSAIVIFIGFILLFIPGLLAIFFLSFAPYILVDKNTGVIESMKASYELVKEYWKVTLALMIVSFVIQLPGSIVPLLGSLVTIALSVGYFCLGALVYVKIAGKKVAVKEAEVVKAGKTGSPVAK